jgi:hypothetical protein
MIAATTPPTAADISCIVTNCASAPVTLLAHENASLIGGAYHHPMTDGPTMQEAAKPSTAPIARDMPMRRM